MTQQKKLTDVIDKERAEDRINWLIDNNFGWLKDLTVVPHTRTTRVFFDDLTVGVGMDTIRELEELMTIKEIDFKRKMITGTLKAEIPLLSSLEVAV